MKKLLRRLAYLFQKRRLERELEDEMAAHREMMPQDRQRAFGNTLRLREEAGETWGWRWLEDLLQDLAIARRSFFRDRRFALSALAAIAVAAGCATAVFSVVDRSLFRALPYRDGDRLVSVGVVAPLISTQDWLFAGMYEEWRARQTVFEAFTSWSGVNDCDWGEERLERLSCARAESTFLPTLGVTPLLGRSFTTEEDLPGGEPVVLLTHALWQSRFGADPNILDRRMTLDGTPARIIGVLPADFETPTLAPADVLTPQMLRPGTQRQRLVRAIARLRPGSTPEAAAAAMGSLYQTFLKGVPADIRKTQIARLRVATLRDQQTREYRIALWMLLGSVAAFVLIACANVANLLLARSAVRQQEFVVRAALGASRGRLVRQSLAESGLLAIAGGVLGCALAFALLRLFVALAPDGTLRLRSAAIDLRVLAFALAMSVAAALLFGLAPALDRLRSEALIGKRATTGPRNWLRRSLITVQLSVSLLLLTGAGLLLTSLLRMQNAPLGFERARIVTASFTLPGHRYGEDIRQLNFFNQLEERLRQMPGAVATAITDSLPPGGDPRSVPFVAMANPGGNAADQGMEGLVKWRYVTPGYFAVLGIPIRQGRGFTDADRQPGEAPVVLSASLARRLFGNDDPVGKRLSEFAPVVIGVAADVRNAGLSGAGDPEFYHVRKTVPGGTYQNQRPPLGWRRATAMVRSSLPEKDAEDLLRATIHRIDPSLPLEFETMERQVERFFTRPRFHTMLLSLFAAAGLVLAGIGLYGLMSFLVAGRTREIGVRMALGASPGSISRLVLSDGLRPVAVGVLLGAAASAMLLRLLEGLLFGAKAYDIRVFVSAVGVLVAVAVIASWLPGRRAARTPPMIALHHD